MVALNICLLDVSCLLQVYCLLDEFIIGGEIQETSKKVGGRRGGEGRPSIAHG